LITGPVLPLPPEGEHTVAVSTRAGTEDRRFTWPALPWDIGTGGNFVVVRARYLAVGGNDERLGTGSRGRAGNDVDLFYRLLRAGVVAAYDPGFLVQHQRATPEERRQRRWSYGFGLGACVAKWLRDGDRYALVALASWVRLRLSLARRGRPLDEARVLLGTVAGLLYGARLTSAAPPADVHEPKPLGGMPGRRQLSAITRPIRAAAELIDPSPAMLARRTTRVPVPPLTFISIYRRAHADRVAAIVSDLPKDTRVALWSLDEHDPRLAHHTVGCGPGARVGLLNRLAEECATNGWLLLSDDDVVFPAGGVTNLLAAASMAGLDVCQPSHAISSIANWRFTRSHRLSIVRETRFVESGPTVLFSPRGRDASFPLPSPDGMGWGLEATWGDPRLELRLGIVDAVRIRHVGAVAVTYDRATEEARGAEALLALGLREWPELQKTSRVWRPWRRGPRWS
jgi:hypothetical protein